MKAKKSYGQHFLINESFASQIADALQLTNQYNNVLEIGPGKGMLTKYLLQRDFELYVVEADRDMVLHLNKYYPQLKERIIPADFLKIDLHPFFKDKPFALIGNFPYNISSQIIFKMLKYREQIPEMVGMFQKEVAKRIISPPGSKVYGVISVLTQAYYEGTFLLSVEPSSFVPPPKVQSAVIRLVRKEGLKKNYDENLFKRVVKQTFAQRRKMLRNTLKPFFKNDPAILQKEFFRKRPEELSVQEFIELTHWIEESN